MQAGGPETRKYIIGWLRFRPGERDGFMTVAQRYAAACRAEKGCLFFEMNPSVADPDVISVVECFASPEAHDAHLRTPWFEAAWAEFGRVGLSGRFENVFASRVEPDAVEFGAAGTRP